MFSTNWFGYEFRNREAPSILHSPADFRTERGTSTIAEFHFGVSKMNQQHSAATKVMTPTHDKNRSFIPRTRWKRKRPVLIWSVLAFGSSHLSSTTRSSECRFIIDAESLRCALMPLI